MQMPGNKLMSLSRIHYCLRSTLGISVGTQSMKNQPISLTKWIQTQMQVFAMINHRYQIVSGTSHMVHNRFMKHEWAPPFSRQEIIFVRCRVASVQNLSKQRLLERSIAKTCASYSTYCFNKTVITMISSQK